MAKPKNPAGTACVPVFDAYTQGENPGPASDPGHTTYSDGLPVTRSPYDVWHSEQYLIGWLVKTHGWRVIEPGLLRRVR